MTRSPQELAQDVRDSTDGLIDATHVGEPWQVSAGQRAYDEALHELVALAEAGERAREALRQIASRELVTRPLGTADGVDYVEPMSAAQIARAALGEGS